MTIRRRDRARRRLAGLAAGLVLSVVPASGQPCLPSRPGVNKPGFRAGATVAWTVADAPGGMPFPEHRRRCVARAFEAWTAANRWSGARVRFTPGDGGIIVRFDKPGGLILDRRHAGAWSNDERAADGALERAAIWITSDVSVVGRCDVVTKIVLHELGHLHGLADARGRRGTSVMNHAGGPGDDRGRLPLGPTRCDALQAATATLAVPIAALTRMVR